MIYLFSEPYVVFAGCVVEGVLGRGEGREKLKIVLSFCGRFKCGARQQESPTYMLTLPSKQELARGSVIFSTLRGEGRILMGYKREKRKKRGGIQRKSVCMMIR